MLFSVIIPTFNRRTLVCETIESVLRQTHADFELIVIDDGSTDGTSEGVAGIASRDARLRLITKDNEGRSIARNRGIENSSGDWLIFLDSDDLLRENALEIFATAIREHPEATLIGAGKTFIDENGTPIPAPWHDNEKTPSYGWIENPHEKLIRDFFFTPGSFCIARFVCPRFYREFEACEDYDFLLTASLSAKVFRLKDAVLLYRWHSGNTAEEKFFDARRRVCVRQLEKIESLSARQRARIRAEWSHKMADDRYMTGEWYTALTRYLKAVALNPWKLFDGQLVRQIAFSCASVVFRRRPHGQGVVQ